MGIEAANGHESLIPDRGSIPFWESLPALALAIGGECIIDSSSNKSFDFGSNACSGNMKGLNEDLSERHNSGVVRNGTLIRLVTVAASNSSLSFFHLPAMLLSKVEES